jgi:IrrE N-terminal-like domain
MRRGFKTSAKRIALDVREELELTPTMPFDPKRWADLWGIPLLSSADIGCSEDSITRFHGSASGSWSAALVPNGNGHLIVYNASHAPVRFMSDVSHEAGHVILEHPRIASVTDGKRCGNSKEIEDEANELAGELLLPASAAFQLARRGIGDGEIAERYEISIEMARWRMTSTGARKVAQRQRAAYDRARGTSAH